MGSEKLYAERPGWGEGFDYDESRHLAAYRYARDLARGKTVMDAGCGEGFGTQTIAEVARRVVGVDYSAEAITRCKGLWTNDNLEFRCVDLAADGDGSEPEPGERFDLILNFQVLEHIAHEPPFLEALKRRLAPGGRLLLTTPNRLKSFSENPCHVREYSPEELASLLGGVFTRVEVLGMHGNEKVVAFDRERERAVRRILRLDPLGLRRLLPSGLVQRVFARLGMLVRKSARKHVGEGRIAPGDFHVSADAVEDALDLVALCEA